MRRLLIILLVGMVGACTEPTVDDGDEFEGDEPGECSDGADNDRDGDFDCLDSGCENAPDCLCDDEDDDGVCDADDLCPGFDDGLDADEDSVPDGCDLCPGSDDAVDGDGDGTPDGCDVCPLDAEDDSDLDGVCDSDDQCPGFDDSADGDGDGTADGCDPCPLDRLDDSDRDGVCDSDDACPGFDDNADVDRDGTPDGCDPCPRDPLNDSDGDGSCDSADLCPGFDDTADLDGDGNPDDCDPCPVDNPDDTDGDGVCDADDLCPLGDDTVDLDGNGIPDACEPADFTPVIQNNGGDYDVSGSGAVAVVRASGGQVLLTCWDSDHNPLRAEFAVGSYDTSSLGPYPSVQVARGTGSIVVTWHDSGGGNGAQSIEYTYLDSACQVVAGEQVAIGPSDEYFEWHATAVDDAGNAVIVVSDDATYASFVDNTGALTDAQTAFDAGGATYGAHVAVNPLTGDGIVTTQIHSGNGIYYRRFNSDGTWMDPSHVQIPVNYHYWYDGHTVGMNGLGDFVLLWRSDGDKLDMKFFDSSGNLVSTVQRDTIDFEGWNGGHCYDSFRLRNQKIPLRGNNFVLGEVYNWITPQANRITHHFEYTPAGAEVAVALTDRNRPEGLTIRTDQVDRTYVSDSSWIYVTGIYP